MAPVDFSEFLDALEYNDVSQLHKLLSQSNVDVNMKDKDQFCLLHYAARFGCTECLKLILNQRDIDVNQTGPDRVTPLFTAIEHNHPNCLRALLSHQDINVNCLNSEKMTPLQYAVTLGHLDCIKALMNHENIDTTIKDKNNQTALDLANESTSFHKQEMIKLINPDLMFNLLIILFKHPQKSTFKTRMGILNYIEQY